MAGGLLDLGNTNSGIDTTQLNELLRPPDRWVNMLAAMSQKLAEAGRPSPVRTSTLGALGTALSAASQASQAGNEQYLAQAAKVHQLRQLMQQQALYQQLQPALKNLIAPLLGGAAPGTPVAPTAPGAIGTAPTPAIPTPGAPAATLAAGGPFTLPNVPDYSGAFGPAAPPAAPAGLGGGDQGARARMQLTSLLGAPGNGLLADPGGTVDPRTGGDLLIPNQGGPAAGYTPTSFRPDQATPLVAAANGAADRLDPAMLRGLLALGGDDTGMAGGGERDGLLGSPDELIRGPTANLPIRQASMQAPRSEAEIIRSESGGKPYAGYGNVDLTDRPRDPETGFPQWEGRMGPAGISHAAGIYQFQPGTYAEGAKALGIKDFSPESQKAVYDWTRAKYGDAPWRASEGGARPGMMLAQYAGGAPGGVPDAASVIQGLMNQRAAGSGNIPGLNATPEQLAALNALTEMAGLKTPFSSFIDLYHKSPGYLQDAARAGALGRAQVGLQYDPITEGMKELAKNPALEQRAQAQSLLDIRTNMAKDGVMMDPNGSGQVVPIPGHGKAMAYNADQLEAVKNKYQTQLAETNAKLETVTVPILQKDRTIADTPMSRYDRDQKQQMQGNRAPQPGDIVGKPSAALPSGYEYRMQPGGTVEAGPIANTPEAAAAQALARTKAIADRQLQVARDSVVAAADRIENNVKTSTLPTTGILGSKLTGVYQPAQDIQADIQNIEARMTLDQLNALRAGSPTGGALGAVSEGEGAKLATAMANLKQSQSKEQFLTNLQVVKQEYINAVHGPGAWKEMSDQPILKTQPPTKEWKENDIVNYPDGSSRQLKNNEWVLTKPPAAR